MSNTFCMWFYSEVFVLWWQFLIKLGQNKITIHPIWMVFQIKRMACFFLRSQCRMFLNILRHYVVESCFLSSSRQKCDTFSPVFKIYDIQLIFMRNFFAMFLKLLKRLLFWNLTHYNSILLVWYWRWHILKTKFFYILNLK